jgi:hypothetical protein
MAMQRLRGLAAAMICVLTIVSPTRAQVAPGNRISLGAPGTAHVDVQGYTKGTVAFFKTISDRDSTNQRCMGYGSLEPDYILDVQQQTAAVTLQIKTRGQDTTLVIEGPNNRLFCADDSPTGGKDAGTTLRDVAPGSYKIWVGIFDPGADTRYQLSIQPN